MDYRINPAWKCVRADVSSCVEESTGLFECQHRNAEGVTELDHRHGALSLGSWAKQGSAVGSMGKCWIWNKTLA